jgi:hypothetical protein
MSEPSYMALWPLGEDMVETVAAPQAAPGLNAVILAELEHLDTKWFPVIRAALLRRFPNIRIVEAPTFGLTHGPHEREVVAKIPERLKAHGAQVAISGIGV